MQQLFLDKSKGFAYFNRPFVITSLETWLLFCFVSFVDINIIDGFLQNVRYLPYFIIVYVPTG